MDKPHASQLGQSQAYPNAYDANLLVQIPRADSRSAWLKNEPLPFSGCDIWTAYEISWLNPKGKPNFAIGEFRFSAQSRCLVESKSFKYYLNSLNQETFRDLQHLKSVLERDLSSRSEGPVAVELSDELDISPTIPGRHLDEIDIEFEHYQPDPALLQVKENTVAKEAWFSRLLKSNCPVTGQPDWATVWVEYGGPKCICPESLLRYIVSFRQHEGFHESCVERIYWDLFSVLKPEHLSVYARYSRRGGLDINPFRSSHDRPVPFGRLSFQ